jgi:hypothetical protein
MKFIRLMIVLVIPLTIFPLAGNSFAVCDLKVLASNEIPFSYPDRNQTTLDIDTISTREIAGRVLSYISEQDALKLLGSVGATGLEPMTNAEGVVTITFDTVLHEVREYVTGECAGVTIGPYNRTTVFFSVHNTISDRTELAYVAVLADTPISPSALHPNIYEIDAKIEVGLEREKNDDGDGKFKFGAKTKRDGKVCFNPQSEIAGEDVCVTLLKDDKGNIRTAQGRIHRRNELFLEQVDF